MHSRPPRRTGARIRGSILVSTLVFLASALLAAPLGSSPAASATTLPSTVEAWLYPSTLGQPACDVPSELTALSADPIAVLKPQYFDVLGSGKLRVDTATNFPCNGYSPANLAEVRAAAADVYTTVSSATRSTKFLLGSSTKETAALATLASFVATNDLNGVDLDFEPNDWTPTLWSAYMGFVTKLVGALSPAGRVVEVDLDAFTTTPWDSERYAAVTSAGAHLVVMAYDHEYAAACSPITPYTWLEQAITYTQSQVPAGDYTIGLPSYGYTTTNCRKVSHVTSNVAYVTMETEPGFPTTPAAVAALRDNVNSGEIRWTDDGVFYDYVDATALNDKLQVAENMGVTDVSVWSLGGEPWFTGNP